MNLLDTLQRRFGNTAAVCNRCSNARLARSAACVGVLFLLAGCIQTAPALRITLAGAQIPVELVESWLHDARDAGDGATRFDVHKLGPVYLAQNGFENLQKSAADAAVTDRPIGKNERAAFGDRRIQGWRVAFYGYALYVHPSNKLDSIFAGHLRYLLQKKANDWKELVGAGDPLAGPIRLIGPEKSSRGGEILLRQANIWFDKPTWEAKRSDAEIIDAVAADPLALGFAGIGLDRGVRYLGLRMDRNDPPSMPSLEEIESERYGLAKVIYVYHADPPTPAIAAMLDYLFSPAGTAAMRSTDVWPLARERGKMP